MGIGNGFSVAGDVQSTPAFDCDVGLGLSYSSPYLHRNQQSSELFGFYRNPINSSYSGVIGGDTGKVLFTATQWQELERQKKIYMYLMASIPVPPHLLLPLSTQSNKVSLRYSYGSDPEPWRCRRTDGKKWRCAKDVAPDQKYCERHVHKTRARSRKPVEAQSHNVKENPSVISTANRQTRCSDWFLKNGTIPISESHNQFQQPISLQDFKGNHQQNSYINTTATDIDSWSRIGSGDECSLTLSMPSGGNGDAFDHESFQMAVGLLSGNREGCGDGFKPHHSWLNQATWGGSVSSSGLSLSPGGPLGEALCLGVPSAQHEPFCHGKSDCTSTGGSCEGGGHGVDFSFVNRHDG